MTTAIPEIVFLLPLAICIVLGAWAIYGSENKGDIALFKEEVLKKLELELSLRKINPQECSFYTSGHPYVWVETSYEAVRQGVQNSCYGPKGMAMPGAFHIKIDKSTNSAYVVVNSKPSFDWGTLKHYEEWLQDNAKYAENIRKHNEQESKSA